jgi:ABC-type phosphate/phosphonate transport system substrate-binding protein
LGLGEHVRVVGQPDYSAYEGGDGELYSSAIVMRRRGSRATVPAAELPEISDVRAPGGNGFLIPLDLIRNMHFAFNSHDSMSGLIALTRDLASLGEDIATFFSARTETGGHRKSIIAVAEGRADVATIDCRSWALARRFEPRARDVAVVGWTSKRMGLPYIAGLNSPLTHLPD